jgi:hypothetical protein
MGPAVLLLLAAQFAVAQTEPPPAPPQPIPFSHKNHVEKGLACKDCHTMPDPGDQAGFPPTAKCMACHATIERDSPPIVTLAGFHARQEPVPWKRVYRVPEYVSFSHKTHAVKAQIDCETCHGPVRQRDAIRKEKPTSMSSCMDCHKARGASLACDFCHDPR